MGEGSSVSRSVGRSGSRNVPIHQGGGGVDFLNNPIVYFVAMYKHLRV